jgi:hypothetical protein
MKRRIVVALLGLIVASVASADCLLTFQTEALPFFFVGQPANFQIVAVSGTEPYHFEINNEFGPLPEGLHLTGSGRIVGVPQAETDTVTYVQVTDAQGCHLTQAFQLTVLP